MTKLQLNAVSCRVLFSSPGAYGVHALLRYLALTWDYVGTSPISLQFLELVWSDEVTRRKDHLGRPAGPHGGLDPDMGLERWDETTEAAFDSNPADGPLPTA